MEQYKQEFIEFMVECNVLKFGDFVTKSGRKTPFFVNTGFYRNGAQMPRQSKKNSEQILISCLDRLTRGFPFL